MPFAEPDLTQDKFLDGKLTVLQPRGGYRAGVDPVFLAAAIPAESSQSVLELGCGVGVASLCLARRVAGIHLVGVELQPDYADLARKNADANSISMQIEVADLRSLPSELRQLNFDHVIANPPYFQRGKGTPAPNQGKDTALAGETPIREWIDVGVRRLTNRGLLTLIQKADRLADVLSAMDQRLGGVVVQPLSPRVGRKAELVIIQARKGARGAFRLNAPIILHEGDQHLRDGESYTDQIRNVLRAAAPLDFDR